MKNQKLHSGKKWRMEVREGIGGARYIEIDREIDIWRERNMRLRAGQAVGRGIANKETDQTLKSMADECRGTSISKRYWVDANHLAPLATKKKSCQESRRAARAEDFFRKKNMKEVGGNFYISFSLRSSREL